jgi:hypothetical protein
MRDYPTLHLDINKSKETACSKKSYGSKWTRETNRHYTLTSIKVKKQLVVRNHMDLIEHERLSHITLGHK